MATVQICDRCFQPLTPGSKAFRVIISSTGGEARDGKVNLTDKPEEISFDLCPNCQDIVIRSTKKRDRGSKESQEQETSATPTLKPVTEKGKGKKAKKDGSHVESENL